MLRFTALLIVLCWIVLALPLFSQTVPPNGSETVSDERKVLGKEESIRRIAAARAALHRGAIGDAEMLVAGDNFRVDPDAAEDGPAAIGRAIIALSDGDLRGAIWSAGDEDRELAIEAAILDTFVYVKSGLQGWAGKELKRLHELEPNSGATKCLSLLVDQMNNGRESVWGVRTGGKDVEEYGLREIPRYGKAPAYALYYYDVDGPPLRIMDFDSKPPKDKLTAFISTFGASIRPGLDEGSGKYTFARAELEALIADQQGIAPLAAGWAKYALQPTRGMEYYGRNLKIIEDQVQKPLQEEHAWNWEHVATWQCGPYQPSGFEIVEYRNLDFADANANGFSGAYETWYFVVFARSPKQYLGSLSIASEEPVPGQRIWFLKRNMFGRPQVIKAYPAAPNDSLARGDLIDLLKISAGPPISAPVRIEDSLSQTVTVFDLLRNSWNTEPLKKYYQFDMIAGQKYAIELTSWDFAASVRVEDSQGRELAHGQSDGSLVQIGEKDPITGALPVESNPTAVVLFTASRSGVYRIIVTTWEGSSLRPVRDSGRYALIVREER
ncbi:MAG TPA: hypothetical protein VKS79_05190 [Gemmataceae bacterium]|nr:hypothetical protein [Gemmataceae bacterium]